MGAVIIPGSRKVLDRKTGKLVDCDATTCPHAIDGVNHAPFAAFGGWSGAVNKAQGPEGQGRGLRLPLLHEPAGAGERRRHHRQDRLQPLPHLAVREHGAVGEGRHEREGGPELPGRHQGQPEQPEHGPRPARAAEPALPAGRARHRPAPDARGRDHGRTRPSSEIEQGWNEITDELGRDTQYSRPTSTRWASSARRAGRRGRCRLAGPGLALAPRRPARQGLGPGRARGPRWHPACSCCRPCSSSSRCRSSR